MAQNPELLKDDNAIPYDHRFYVVEGDNTVKTYIASKGVQSSDRPLATPGSVAASGASGKVTVTFNAVTDAERYGIEWRRNDNQSVVTYVSTTALSKEISGLTAGVHNVRVRSEANDGYTMSDWSSWTNGTAT